MISGVPRVPLLASPVGDELRTLLSPLTPEAFVRDYWAKKPLFVKGFAQKYHGFFDAETFSRVISGPGPFPDDFLRASFDQKTSSGTSAPVKVPGDGSSSVFRASVDQAVALYSAGATLCVSQIETRVPSLGPFLAGIKRQLGFPGKVCFNAYLSPPGSGFNWHFDSRIASTLQIEGTKRWRYSNSLAIAWPRANGTLRDGTAQYADPSVVAQHWERLIPFNDADTTEVLLEPGDLLILPAGIWHEACGGAGGSLALNLSFNALSYTVLVRNVLDAVLAPEAGWRGASPVLPGETPGLADPAGVAAISAELSRAAAVLQALSGDSAAVVRLWQSMVQNLDSASAAPQPPNAGPPVAANARLRVRRDGNIHAMLADGGSRLCLAVGPSGSMELTGEAVAFTQRILAEREFVAADCVRWNPDGTVFAWSDVAAMLTTLKHHGLIEDAHAG